MNRAAAALAPVLVLVAAACSGGSSKGGPVPQIKEAYAERDIVDGQARLSSTVTVDFDRSFTVASGDLPFASHFEIDVPDVAGGAPIRALVSKAVRGESNSRRVILTVDRLVPDGSTLRIARRAFNRDATGELMAPIAAELNTSFAFLASNALAAANPDLVTGQDTAEVTPEHSDPAAMRAALEAHLRLRGSPEDLTQAALGRYDTIPEDIVPSPKLRAALAGLTGTFAEAAIDSLLTEDNCTDQPALSVIFQPPPSAPQLLARVTYTNRRRVVSINLFAEGERFELLMPVLAHESIHCDGDDGIEEEIAATAFDSFLYIHLLAADPGLAMTGTRVARELNIDAIAMINSGRRLPESVGVLRSAGVSQVLPDTNVTHQSFAELVAAAYPGLEANASPAEQVAVAYAAALAPQAGMDVADPFNLIYLDELLSRAMDPRIFGAAIAALELAPARP